jgi:polysaccharide biosynthesis transport protein
MKKSQPQSSKEAFGPQDVIYILFKHKWKIIVMSLLGFTASAVVYANRKPLYESQAKLLVRYVLNRNSVDPFQSQMNPTGGPGDSIINTEIEILKSEDLAKAVAEAVGVEKLMPLSGGNATIEDAAGLVCGQLSVAVAPGSNVVHINYSAEDPELSVSVLGELVQQYFIKHLQIHRSANAFELVSKQAEEVEKRLKATELELDGLRTKSGITTLVEATSALSTQRARTQEDLMVAKAELAEQLAKVKSVKAASGFDVPSANAVNPANPPADGKEVVEKTPVHVVGEYKSLLDVLAVLQKRDFELRLKFKSGNRLVTLNDTQVKEYEAKRLSLVKQYPDLVNETAALDPENKTPQWSLSTENAKLASIMARVDVYENHLKEIKNQFNEQYAVGAKIEALERKRQMEDAEFRSLELNLKNAKVDQTLDPSRMPNITMVQQPSKPIKTYDKVTQKIVLGLAGFGMALGLGAAFLIELLFDRRIKRPTEIQARNSRFFFRSPSFVSGIVWITCSRMNPTRFDSEIRETPNSRSPRRNGLRSQRSKKPSASFSHTLKPSETGSSSILRSITSHTNPSWWR